jgi:DNA invertase Pin-like site-specific DNA recombinase
VSTITQTLEQQTEALTAAGAGKIFHDIMSGARDDRPGFTECLQYLREGDTLIVWRLDRLGRNMRSIVNTLHDLTERGVNVRSLHDGVDTSTSTGRMVAGILMSIAEYERELIRERTALKLEHARKSGRKFGRPAKLNGDQAALARRMKSNGETAATHLRDSWNRADDSVPVFGGERRGLNRRAFLSTAAGADRSQPPETA